MFMSIIEIEALLYFRIPLLNSNKYTENKCEIKQMDI